MDSTGSATISGATYDPQSGRLYITERYGESPAVHVYQITVEEPLPYSNRIYFPLLNFNIP
jgi:hypothetical protein